MFCTIIMHILIYYVIKSFGVLMKNKIFTILKMTICMYATTVILLLLLTFIFYKAQISNSKIIIGIVAIYFLSTFVGGYIFGKVMENKKYLYGLSIGAIYFVLLFIVSAIVSKNFSPVSGSTLGALISCLAGGTFGGMIS